MSAKKRTRAQSPARALTRACACLAALALPAVSAAANPVDPFAKLAELGAPVGDEELGDIRGKFLRANDISFFGISMVTSWQDDNGVTTVARLVFSVDFLSSGPGGDPVPALLIGYSREGDPDMDVADAHAGYTPIDIGAGALPVGSLGTTSGAAQANIIAGADNNAHNGLRIALVPTSQLPNLNAGGLHPLDGTFARAFADGDTVQFRVGANELAISMTGNAGSDTVLQSIGGDLGRMLQQTVLNSDGNAIANDAAIVIGSEQAGSGFQAIRASEALSVMHGHGF